MCYSVTRVTMLQHRPQNPLEGVLPVTSSALG